MKKSIPIYIGGTACLILLLSLYGVINPDFMLLSIFAPFLSLTISFVGIIMSTNSRVMDKKYKEWSVIINLSGLIVSFIFCVILIKFMSRIFPLWDMDLNKFGDLIGR